MTPIRKRMLKAIKGKFTAREADARIRGFLKKFCCPWQEDDLGSDCKTHGGAICRAMFPKTKINANGYVNCPCHEYLGGYKYVKKRAMEALK